MSYCCDDVETSLDVNQSSHDLANRLVLSTKNWPSLFFILTSDWFVNVCLSLSNLCL